MAYTYIQHEASRAHTMSELHLFQNRIKLPLLIMC